MQNPLLKNEKVEEILRPLTESGDARFREFAHTWGKQVDATIDRWDIDEWLGVLVQAATACGFFVEIAPDGSARVGPRGDQGVEGPLIRSETIEEAVARALVLKVIG